MKMNGMTMMMNNFKYFRGYVGKYVGRRGRTVMDVGYVWAPYIPDIAVSITRTEPAGNHFGRLNLLRNRYGRVVDTDIHALYGHIMITNQLNTNETNNE